MRVPIAALSLVALCVATSCGELPAVEMTQSAVLADPCLYNVPYYPNVLDYHTCDGRQLNATIVANRLQTDVPGFDPDGEYRVYAPRPGTTTEKKLLLYLPGTGGENTDKEQILKRAAHHGYHVIALKYWNDDGGEIDACGKGPRADGTFKPHSPCYLPSIDDCNPYTDTTPITYDECAIRYFRNAFSNQPPDANGRSQWYTNAHVGKLGSWCVDAEDIGHDIDQCTGPSAGQRLNDEDAALNRARKLLKYLDRMFPGHGWGNFVPGTGQTYDDAPFLDWDKVTLMGHSTGSKVLFHQAHERKVARLIMLSGPNVPETRYGLAMPYNLDSYVETPSKTPLDRIYAFGNTYDHHFVRALHNWQFMTDEHHMTLPGAVYEGGWESRRSCNGCRACGEKKPVAPDAGSGIRAIQYSGNFAWCLGRSPSEGTDTDHAHPSTTRDDSCKSGDPESCWYLAIWDYLLT